MQIIVISILCTSFKVYREQREQFLFMTSQKLCAIYRVTYLRFMNTNLRCSVISSVTRESVIMHASSSSTIYAVVVFYFAGSGSRFRIGPWESRVMSGHEDVPSESYVTLSLCVLCNKVTAFQEMNFSPGARRGWNALAPPSPPSTQHTLRFSSF